MQLDEFMYQLETALKDALEKEHLKLDEVEVMNFSAIACVGERVTLSAEIRHTDTEHLIIQAVHLNERDDSGFAKLVRYQ